MSANLYLVIKRLKKIDPFIVVNQFEKKMVK